MIPIKITYMYILHHVTTKHVTRMVHCNMHTIRAVLWFNMIWISFTHNLEESLRWQSGNLTISLVPVRQPWRVWVNVFYESIESDDINSTKQTITWSSARLRCTLYNETDRISKSMMMGQHGNVFRITDPLWGKTTAHTKRQSCGTFVFSLLLSWSTNIYSANETLQKVIAHKKAPYYPELNFLKTDKFKSIV